MFREACSLNYELDKISTVNWNSDRNEIDNKRETASIVAHRKVQKRSIHTHMQN
jgi:hypothetical protein